MPAVFEWTDIRQISGITEESIRTIGSLYIELANTRHEFHLVDNSFPIIEDGILSADFLRSEKATICFKNNYLISRETGVIPFNNHRTKTKTPPRILITSVTQTPKVRITTGELTRQPSTFIVDTGADVNIIKLGAIHPHVPCKLLEDQIHVTSAIHEPIKVVGTTSIRIEKIIPNNTSKPFKLLNEDYILIPPRTAQVIALKISNPSVKTGFIEQLEVGANIFLGQALVTNQQGFAYVYAINSNESAVEIRRPVVTLEEVDELASTATLSEKTHLTHTINLAIEFNHLFFLPGDTLGHTNLISHTIPTTNDAPIHTKQYRHPRVHKDEIQKQVTKLLDQNIITHSSSPYNSPVWIIPKKSDASGEKKWRMVIDFRKLNEKTIGDAYPLPNIVDILDQLGSAKYFSTFDLASGFHQIPMDPDHSAKTAFSTPHGHFEYTRMPFGLKNAPSTFQRLMDQVLSGLQGTDMFVYLDDIVIYSRSLEEHETKFRKLMKRLSDAGLTLQPDKCEFLRKEVAYLGHVITQNGLKPNPEKISAIKNYPVPKNPKQIKQFLGLIGYYRRFIPNLSKIARPINNLLKKNSPFLWTAEHQFAFETLRDSLCREPILQYPDFEKPFVLTTHASKYAIGAILSQDKDGEDLPIAYASRVLQKAEINYSVSEKEFLAVVYAVKHFRPYLYGRTFTLVTDHEPLKWIKNVRDPTSRLMHWRLKLEEYSYVTKHKKGIANSNADALSRNPPVDSFRILPITSKRPRPDTECSSTDAHKRAKVAHQHPTRAREPDTLSSSTSAHKRTKIAHQHPTRAREPDTLSSSTGAHKRMKHVDQHPIRAHESAHESTNPSPRRRNKALQDTSTSTGTSDSNASMTDNSSATEAPIVVDKTIKQTTERIQPLTSSESNQNSGKPQGRSVKIREEQSDTLNKPTPEATTSKGRNYAPRFTEFVTDLNHLPLTHSKFIQEIRANLLDRQDNLAHCISADCKTSRGVAGQLINRKIITRDQLQQLDPEVTTVLTLPHGNRLIYNLVTKKYHYQKPTEETLFNTLVNLKNCLEQDKVKSLSIPRLGCGLDKLDWNLVNRMIHYIFKDSDITITICNYQNPTYDSTSSESEADASTPRIPAPPLTRRPMRRTGTRSAPRHAPVSTPSRYPTDISESDFVTHDPESAVEDTDSDASVVPTATLPPLGSQRRDNPEERKPDRPHIDNDNFCQTLYLDIPRKIWYYLVPS
ncbi:uncharacterized protein LOC124301349 [Neodiprion virginianus]|uniref:uncharacterized protein LOC124301349 n=1 Tax=Neodiprion virginianus TaxID=2961670 RepID=UPI001EE77BD2|nr:uncharacterized protein LOC124301349 [Neodiprion virginianus]